MNLLHLSKYTEIFKKELANLPLDFISEQPRPQGEWIGSQYIDEIIAKYADGKYGWLKGGQDHVEDTWISWPIIWDSQAVPGNCALCPMSSTILLNIEKYNIKVAGFALMKGGVKLKEHTDHVTDGYLFTYHLGIKCPDKCNLHIESGPIEEVDGKQVVFNAKNTHWAENGSEEDRVILYIEVYS